MQAVMTRISLTKPDDWHLHLRSGEAMKSVVVMSAAQMGRAIVMPNLSPPIKSVHQAQAYRKKIIEAQATAAAENPFAFGYLLNVLYLYHQKPTEITIINDKNSELISALRKKFLPESIMITVRNNHNLSSLSKHAFFSGKEFQDDKTIVFVCKNFSCSLPLSDLSEIEKEF